MQVAEAEKLHDASDFGKQENVRTPGESLCGRGAMLVGAVGGDTAGREDNVTQ